MKNGLVLLLLMVALVAMTVSAGAMAPVVGPLPAVVVGGADTVDDATTDVALLRYVNVFNLADPGVITRRTNPDDVSKLAVWYTVTGTSAATLKASNTSMLVTQMTADEAASLTVNGQRPTADKLINTPSDTWLSLIEDAPGSGSISAVSAASANVYANGAPTADLAAVEGKKTVTLYAVDVDTDTNAVGTGSFDVYSLISSKDGLSPRTNVATGASPIGVNPWIYVSGLGKTTTTASVGWTGRASLGTAGYVYSTWGKIITPNINPTGFIYEVKATMTGSAAASINTPGYRLFFIANLGVHSGGMQFQSTPNLTATDQNIPKASLSKECRIYWAAPRDLVGMADGGTLGTKRAYGLQFDMVQEQTSDSGNNIMMTAFTCDLIPRPVDIVPAIKWADGTNGALKMYYGVQGKGWYDNAQTIAGYGAGTATVGQTNITMGMGSANSAYKKVNLGGADPLPAWTSGKLIRTTYLTQAAGASVPAFRLKHFFFASGNLAQIITIDNFNYDAVRLQAKPSVALPIMPGTPKLAGSVIESYTYSHTAPNVAGTFQFPELDVVQSDQSGTGATSNWNGWGKPGNIVFNSIAIEVLNP